jgi:integrase
MFIQMPKKAKSELIQCSHFSWRLSRRDGVWYADGRTNPINAGRHSLGTRDKAEARESLVTLDEVCAVKCGLIDKKTTPTLITTELLLADGRRLYEEHIGRSRVTGGVKRSTQKRYRAVFDKFLPWAAAEGTVSFHQVDAKVLNRYASHLEKKDYSPKTLLNELTTLKQCKRWLIDAGHLVGCEPIKLKLRKAESQRAYCYRPVEVEAIVKRCRDVPTLGWIGDAVTALACTGVRIGELATLKWGDVDLVRSRITLADESGRSGVQGESKRTTKSGRSRSFPLHPVLTAILTQLPRRDQYVFHGPNGGRLKPDFVRRMLVRHVLKPLAQKFPAVNGGQSFIDGRLHSFRHYFVSMCAANRVPEQAVMDWVGHADSAMVRHYFHMHDEEAQRRMNGLDLLGGAAGWSGSEGSKA